MAWAIVPGDPVGVSSGKPGGPGPDRRMIMTASRLDLLIGNSAMGVNNPAIMTFHFLDPVEPELDQVLAQAMAFYFYCSPGTNTFFHSARWAAGGADGSIPLSMPAAELAAIHAVYDDVVALTNYGEVFGSGEISAAGVGGTCSLYTNIPGRSTTGRVYTPYLAESAIASGFVFSTARTGIELGYRTFIMGEDADAPVVPLLPVVHSQTAGDTIIVNPSVSITPSRLKTRTR